MTTSAQQQYQQHSGDQCSEYSSPRTSPYPLEDIAHSSVPSSSKMSSPRMEELDAPSFTTQSPPKTSFPVIACSKDDIDVKLMQRFYHWPFFAIGVIHLRLLLFQVTHQYFDLTPSSTSPADSRNEGIFLLTFLALTTLSFIMLLFSHCIPKRWIQHQLSKYLNDPPSFSTLTCVIDNVAVFTIVSCFSGLILLLTVHSRMSSSYYSYSMHDHNKTRNGTQTHLGCAIHNEFLFYALMMPFLLQCKSVHASDAVMYSSWVLACVSATLSLALTTIPDHTMFVLPFALALYLVSIVVLVYHRQRKQRELQFYDQFEDLKSKHNELTTLLESKQQEVTTLRHMLANYAHDMKMPIISTISGCEQVKDFIAEHIDTFDVDIDEEVSDDNLTGCFVIQQTLADMVNANEFMLVGIHRCMEYAKVADGVKLVPKYETCQLQESIRTVLHCLSSTTDKDKVRIFPLPSNLCSHILTDKQWFQENILCLLSNAVKFTPSGNKADLRLSLIAAPISTKDTSVTPNVTIKSLSGIARIAAGSSGSNATNPMMILVEVEDRGIGISKDMQTKLFAPFQQAQKHAGGTGLGLFSLSKRVEALGGSFGVRDRLDGQQGSLFWFTFPYRPDTITETMLKWDPHSSSSSKVSANMSKAKQGLGRGALVVPFVPPLSTTLPANGASAASWSAPSSPTGTNGSISSKVSATQSKASNSVVSASTVIAIVEESTNGVPSSATLERRYSKVRPENFSSSPVISKSRNRVSSEEETIISYHSDIQSVVPADTGRKGSIDEESAMKALTAGCSRNDIKKQELKPIYRILLADDSSSNRKVLTQILRQRGGHEVIAVENGLEAVNKLTSSRYSTATEDSPDEMEEVFDVVILDLHMPVMDGFEAMRRIREQENHAKTLYHEKVGESRLNCCPNNAPPMKPRQEFIIGCSANDDDETVEDTLQAGADAFLPKPFSLDQFLECMALKK